MNEPSSQDVRDVAETILKRVGKTATSIQSRAHSSHAHKSWSSETLAATHLEELKRVLARFGLQLAPNELGEVEAARRLFDLALEHGFRPRRETDSKEKARSRAAQPVLDRLARRLPSIPDILRPMLIEIGRRFFDSQQTIAKIKKQVGAGTWHTRLFLKSLGITAQDLRLECKMEMGLRLLRDTSKTVEQVADAVGYDSNRSLGMLCLRWCALVPAELRLRLKTPAGEFGCRL